MQNRACLALLAILVCHPVIAQEGVSSNSKQRTEQQKPGLPPPYYYYPNGAPTTSHVELSCDDAIKAALAHSSQAELSHIDEEIALREITVARGSFFPAL